MLVSAFVVGCLRPRVAWVGAAIIGASVRVAHVVARLLALDAPYAVSLSFTALAFVPAFLGAGVARTLRGRRVSRPDDSRGTA